MYFRLPCFGMGLPEENFFSGRPFHIKPKEKTEECV